MINVICNRARRLLPAGLLLLALGAQADNLQYTVVLDAPPGLQDLLEKNLDLNRWHDNPRLDAGQLQLLYRQAPEQIRTLAATEGFYTPVITSEMVQQGQAWRIQFTVEPGAPTLVGAVDLAFQGAIASQPQAAGLRNGWALPPGLVFRQAEWEAAKNGLLRKLLLERYPRARLTQTQATVDPLAHTAALQVVIDSGPEMRFGALAIDGLQRYPATIISRINTIKPGDPYNEAALLELQSRLLDGGYFSRVDVSAEIEAPEQPGSAALPAVLPVKVSVTENQRKKAGIGVGYSTNTGNRAKLTYEDLNFLQRELKLKSALTLETKKQSAAADIYLPLTERGVQYSAGLSYVRSDIEDELSKVSSIAFKRSWGKPALERNLTLEYLSEKREIAGIVPRRSRALPLSYGATWRQTDSLLFPTEGSIIHAQLGGALGGLLSDQSFGRGIVRIVHYTPMGKKDLAILRGEFGTLASRSKNGVPDAYLFRAGGDQSVRGYAYQSLGVAQGAATVGGRYLMVGSAEYQHWFLPQWGAAVFADAGNAADTIAELKPKAGYGVGARWRSPVGPINLDLAYGQADRKVRMHFSLGVTF
ncbi:autotransporter assembly complex family protein [Herminiimonas sp. CN]|uniref:autotransporter assembly complex protein TamA n=1 Tax=Herminiimonas sp. CN TaxID=1349818 RepID=UPI0004743299|nr:autotransporter assembly complex family protein [Herminiimonas sp. CN]